MDETNVKSLCIMCNTPHKHHCGVCRSSHYCSSKCQKADWPSHKLLCKSFSDYSSSSRPTENHYRAILFPADKKKPEFIWLPCEWNEDGDDERYLLPNFKNIINGTRGFTYLRKNELLRRSLANAIDICYRDTFLLDGSPPNMSVSKLSGDDSGNAWRGDILAYGMRGLKLDSQEYRDMDMGDFRTLVDFFNGYQTNTKSDASRGEKVSGVKINCIGDQETFGAPKFEAVEVPTSHPIFYHHDKSEIAKRIGLPLLAHQYPANKSWSEGSWDKFRNNSPFNNQAATFLHLCCDKRSEQWGWAPFKWQHDVGSVLIVREDKKPLLPLHMEAISRYCQYEAAPLFEHSMGGYDPENPMSKEVVLITISRASFMIFWYKFIKEKNDYSCDSPY